MYARPLLVPLLCFGLVSACLDGGVEKPEGADSAEDSGGTDTADSSDTADSTDTAEAVPPCAGETWGALADPDAAIHVRADGSDEGSGSATDPVATLAAALALSRVAGAPDTVFVGPGEFVAGLTLRADDGDGVGDDGLALLGCSTDETTLVADDEDAPLIKIGEATGVSVASLTLSGGRRALWIWSGAEVAVSDVIVDGSTRVGVVVDGVSTVASLEGVEVHDPVPETDSDGVEVGYGVLIDGATVTMTGGGVWGATRLGILADAAILDLSDLTVDGTAPDASGELGRGIQVQSLSTPTLTDVQLTGNTDAGLASIQSFDLVLERVLVDGTLGVAVPDTGEESGDGIVVSQGGDDTDHVDVSYFNATITSCEVTASARAGIVVDETTGVLTDNVASSDNGLTDSGVSLFAQNGAVVSGPDTVVALSEAVSFNWRPVVPDSLSE